MIIQYCSDLHLEFKENERYLKENPIKPIGEILLMAGDILPLVLLDKPCDFLDFVSDHFKEVYWLPGNHEYYHFDITQKCGTFNEKIRNNVFLVNNLAVIHEEVKFIFSTLWSKISPAGQWYVEKSVNDFHLIKYKNFRFSSTRFNEFHEQSLDFIKNELALDNSDKSVVITHHVPTLMNYPEQYKGSLLNEAFAVELFDLIEDNSPDYWIYGHHHSNTVDFNIGKTHLLTNQLGYVSHNEHNTFKHNAIIDL